MKGINTLGRLFLFAASAFLFSCVTPPPVLDLSPAEGKTEWVNGNAWITKKDRRIRYQVAFVDYKNYEIHFNIKVTNNSWRSILVDPSLFYCVPLEGESDNIASENFIYAHDPEEVIIDYKKRIHREQKNYKTDQGVNAVFGCLGIIGSFGAKGEKEQEDADEFLDDMNESMDDREIEHEKRQRKYNRAINFWQKAVLRKTTLKPHQSIGGTIVFAADHHADRVLLFVKGGKKTLNVFF